MSKFVISGFSDEIDSSVDIQFDGLNRLGIKYFEPRNINGKNIADITLEEAEKLKEKMDENGIEVSSIGSPIGKISITDDFDRHLELLGHVIELAKVLETKYIRVFSFYIPKDEKPEKYRDEVMRRMKAMAGLAKKENVMLLHENEKEIYGDIAPRCEDILKTVNSSHLRAVFDPANFVQCGQKVYPDAYELLKPYIEYIHIKDAKTDGHVVPAGAGIGCVENVLKSLKESGYDGFLSLEPHLGKFEGLSKLENGDIMKGLEKSGMGTFTLAYESLNKILERI